MSAATMPIDQLSVQFCNADSPKESFLQQHKVAILMIGGAALIISGVALCILTNQGVGALSNCGDIAYCLCTGQKIIS